MTRAEKCRGLQMTSVKTQEAYLPTIAVLREFFYSVSNDRSALLEVHSHRRYSSRETDQMSSMDKQVWGNDTSGQPVHLYTFRNSRGTEAAITDFGGRIVRLKTADRKGQVKDVVLGFDTLDGYLAKNPFLGALVGRYANRIANGRFSLNGNTYQLAQNNGQNALHGGLKGFDKVVWESREIGTGAEPSLHLRYVSKD